MREAALGLVVMAAVAWPTAGFAATAGSAGPPMVLLAVIVGAAIALGAVFVLQRWRERSTVAELRQTLAASSAAWWRADADGRITDVEAGQLAGGARFDALRGRTLLDLATASGADSGLAAALAAGHSFREVPLTLVEAPGRWVLNGAALRNAGGQISGFAGAVQAAGAAADQPGSLQADLDDRSRQLAERTRELDNAVRELDSFAYSVSHDLRAPLRIVDGFATIVLEDYGDRGKPLDDVGRDHLRRIAAASQRMNTMIDTLLGLSKMTSRELARERVDLSQIARELAEDLGAQDGARAVDFVIAPNLRTDGDATLLRLVLQNLLGNAYKFTAKTREARVEFGLRSDGPGAAYFVKDNGAGFDMRFAEKMFGLFQRLHSANEFPGTGVGLATVQKIVRRHGGRVWAEAIAAPNEGHGATFFFTLWEKS